MGFFSYFIDMEDKHMKRELLVMVFAASLILAGATIASATVVTWKIMQDTSMAGVGPGGDDLIGTVDDSTSGQNNNCNFNPVANCATSGTPTTGSWSLVALELPQTASCLSGNLGDPCTTNANCGSGGICIPCPDNPITWDAYSYEGKIPGKKLGNGTMVTCQELNDTRTTEINFGSTESIGSGTGATCINLRTSPTPFTGGCGPGQSFTSVSNIKFSLGCNPALGAGQIDGLTMNGRVYATGGINNTNNCGYSTAEIDALRAAAAGIPAGYLLVMCGNTSIPNDSTTTSVCLRGASVWSTVVAYTTNNASSCTDPDPLCTPSSCAGGVAEAAQ